MSTHASSSRVAVVIPCRNEAEHIGSLLDALAAQTKVPDEVIIVDDHSTDDTGTHIHQWQAAHPRTPVTVVTGRGLGPGPAVNDGIRRTNADIIIRFDAHSLPSPDYVARSVDALDEPGVGVAGGVWRVAPGADTSMARAIAHVVSHPLGSGGALYRHADAAGPVRVSVETVPFGAFRWSLWEQVGGFDESLEANQDFDFNYRVRKAGRDVLLDRRIAATYFARPTLAALRRQYFRYGFWKRQMLRKDPRALHLRQLPPVFVLPWIVATLIWFALVPGIASVTAVGLYPLLVTAAGVQIGITRSVNPLAAAAALATVHGAWSAGFWRGMTR